MFTTLRSFSRNICVFSGQSDEYHFKAESLLLKIHGKVIAQKACYGLPRIRSDIIRLAAEDEMASNTAIYAGKKPTRPGPDRKMLRIPKWRGSLQPA